MPTSKASRRYHKAPQRPATPSNARPRPTSEEDENPPPTELTTSVARDKTTGARSTKYVSPSGFSGSNNRADEIGSGFSALSRCKAFRASGYQIVTALTSALSFSKDFRSVPQTRP